jgi:hypothetical protein
VKIDDYFTNAPHHPEIIAHPYHKHIGPKDRLAPADQPSLGQILTEIQDLISNKSEP